MRIFQNKPVKTLRWLGLALTLTFGLVAIIASGGGGSDSSDDGSNVLYDLSGEWTGTQGSVLISGGCPPNPPSQRGTVTITQSSASFTLTFGNGFDCSPASACVFTNGSINGATYTASNSGVADNEGGKYFSTLELTATSATSATGVGTSAYVHPSGFRCDWTTSLKLDKK